MGISPPGGTAVPSPRHFALPWRSLGRGERFRNGAFPMVAGQRPGTDSGN